MNFKDFKLKVVKANNGLEVGDILNYDEENGDYFIYKELNDISENSEVSTKTYFSISAWSAKENSNFIFVDKEGNEIKFVRIYDNCSNLKSEPVNEVVEESVDVEKIVEDNESMKEIIGKLNDKNKELQEKLDSIKWVSKEEYDLYKNINRYSNPFYFWF